MKQPAITTAIIIFILLVAGMATYTYLKHRELQMTVEPVLDTSVSVSNDGSLDSTNAVEPVQDVEDDIPMSDTEHSGRVTVSREYQDGVHFVVGEVMASTPCHTLEQTIMVAESYPEQVTIELFLTPGDGMCAQVMTSLPFTAEVTVAEAATFSYRLNGEMVAVAENVIGLSTAAGLE